MQTIFLIPSQNSKYHFGDLGLETSSFVFHSDSLFSAIVNNYVKLYGDEINNDITEIKKIKLSSVFPAIKSDNETIYFIPKPKLKLNIRKEDEKKIEDKPKDIKEIQFISLSVLDNHNKNKVEFYDDLIIDKKFLIIREELEKIYKTEKLFEKEIEEKILVSRSYKINEEEREEGKLYTVEFIKPEKNVIFYFVYDDSGIDELVKNKIKTSIRLIADEGLGGKLSSGAGHFKDIEFKGCKQFDNLTSNYYLNLSLVIPKDKEEFNLCKSYTLLERKGYIYSLEKTQRRKSVLMIEEGSIFSQQIRGNIADVSPDNYPHPVYKFGYFLSIPIKVNNDK